MLKRSSMFSEWGRVDAVAYKEVYMYVSDDTARLVDLGVYVESNNHISPVINRIELRLEGLNE